MHKLRYEYALLIYQREFSIKERLEAKAAVTFALPSTLVAALFLQKDERGELWRLWSSSANSEVALLAIVLFAVVVVSISLSLLFSVLSIFVLDYRKEYPKKLYSFLMNPDAEYLRDEASLQDEIASRLSIATEHNAKVNDKKSQYLTWSVFGLLASVVSLLVFVVLSFLVT